MSDPVNLYDLELSGDPANPEGYRGRGAGITESIGGDRLGGSVYEIGPGDSTAPYHFEGVEEEWLLVLTGTPTLRDPTGEHGLVPGDLVCFPVGPEGAHKLTNASGEVARVLMLSTVPKPDVSICVYPDSDKMSVWPPGKRVRMTPDVGYWDGEA